jgi:hypothetical protein
MYKERRGQWRLFSTLNFPCVQYKLNICVLYAVQGWTKLPQRGLFMKSVRRVLRVCSVREYIIIRISSSHSSLMYIICFNAQLIFLSYYA